MFDYWKTCLSSNFVGQCVFQVRQTNSAMVLEVVQSVRFLKRLKTFRKHRHFPTTFRQTERKQNLTQWTGINAGMVCLIFISRKRYKRFSFILVFRNGPLTLWQLVDSVNVIISNRLQNKTTTILCILKNVIV